MVHAILKYLRFLQVTRFLLLLEQEQQRFLFLLEQGQQRFLLLLEQEERVGFYSY
jgi:hypothetical protein